MTPLSHNIKNFQTLNSLLAAIAADAADTSITARRYPVRFILLDNFDSARVVTDALRAHGASVRELETLIAGEDVRDTLPTHDEVLAQFRNALANDGANGNATAASNAATSVIFSPVSEIIRFYNDTKFRAFLSEISLLEASGGTRMRIYVPLIGLSFRFKQFHENFYRARETIPPWKFTAAAAGATPGTDTGDTGSDTDSHKNIEVFLIPEDFSVPPQIPSLRTFYDYLVFWKTHHPQDKEGRVLSASDTLNFVAKYAQPDTIFTFPKIENEKQFLEKYLHCPIPFDYADSENIFWKQLVSECAAGYYEKTRQFVFREFLLDHFNTQKLSPKVFVEKWLHENTSNFDRWLLCKHILCHCPDENKYLTAILRDPNAADCASPLKLVERILLAVFEISPPDAKTVTERKQLLAAIGAAVSQVSLATTQKVADAIEKIAEKGNAQNAALALELIIGNSTAERELIIRWAGNGKMEIATEKLREIYPDLADYLGGTSCLGETKSENAGLTQYFQKYKTAKLRDTYTADISSSIAELNRDESTFWKWFHSFPTTENLLGQSPANAGDNRVDKVVWMDGLGAEFLPLITSIVQKSRNFSVLRSEIATVPIPSATEFNRPAGVHEKFDNLDAFIHSEQYRHPATLVREIEIVRAMLERVLRETEKCTIAIVSDHGLTALSRLVESRKYGWTGISHEGRYAEIPAGDSHKTDSDYLTRDVNGTHYRVALRHNSLDTKPTRETHGGATPEEVLVPFLIISNKTAKTGHKPSATPEPQMALPPSEKNQPNKANKAFIEDDMF